ncbi:MAG: hypothetical protein Q8N14_07310 [Candidatus Omnitrophota bacterium]|nr:hypothetical protein [Candidatus Omnitrophota bacterium]
MIVVAIIALLAAIAIPNLLRARITANNANAQSTLRTISTASETWAAAHNGDYPATSTDLTGAVPPYMNRNYCTLGHSGFSFTCTMATTGYTIAASPVSANQGDTTYQITTGGILTQP